MQVSHFEEAGDWTRQKETVLSNPPFHFIASGICLGTWALIMWDRCTEKWGTFGLRKIYINKYIVLFILFFLLAFFLGCFFFIYFDFSYLKNFLFFLLFFGKKIKGSMGLVSDCETFTHLPSSTQAQLTKCLFKMQLLRLLPSGEDISEPGVSA